MKNLAIYYKLYFILTILYTFSTSSIAQSTNNNIYQVYEGTKHYEEQLNEIYDILKLGRTDNRKEYRKAVNDFKLSKGYYSSSTSTSTQYQNDKQRKFRERNNNAKIKLRYKKEKKSQKEFIWTILDKHENGIDTLININLNFHLYTTKIKDVKYVLVRQVDYKTLINKQNDVKGYFSFDAKYYFERGGELKTSVNFRMAIGKSKGGPSRSGAGFDITVTNAKSGIHYMNDLELSDSGEMYERIFNPKGELLQKSKNLKINFPLKGKKESLGRIYKQFKGSRYYVEDLNEIYDILQLSLGDFDIYQRAIKRFRVSKGYEDEEGMEEVTFGGTTSLGRDLRKEIHYDLMREQSSAQKKFENLKFPKENKKEKKFVWTFYEGKPELGDTLMHFFFKYYYVKCNLMDIDYNLVYQVDYEVKIDTSQGQENGFYLNPRYEINGYGDLTTEFYNTLWFLTENIEESVTLELQADSYELRSLYANEEGFRIGMGSEKYFYQYIFKPEKKITEVKVNEFFEEEDDEDCFIMKELEELYKEYMQDNNEVHLRSALHLINSTMKNCKDSDGMLFQVKLKILFLLKEYDLLFTTIDSLDINLFQFPQQKEALKVNYKAQVYKEQGELEELEKFCNETILSLETKLKTFKYPARKKVIFSSMFDLKVLFESKEKVIQDIEVWKTEYPRFQELFDNFEMEVDYKYDND